LPDAVLTSAWLGRVVNALGEPIDGKGALLLRLSPCPVRATPPLVYPRRRVGIPLDLGVRALTFVTCGRARGMGILTGSGVGAAIAEYFRDDGKDVPLRSARSGCAPASR
jgi:flagellum-specific ATP synthase